MTTEIQMDDSVSETSADVINIGETLKRKRLELEFDERHVATELKIPIEQVRALEANNFQRFRSVTFARGFLKSYSRLLGIDHTEIISAFDAERESAESTIKPVDKVNKQTHLGDPFVIFISVVIVAVLVFLVFWWPSQSSKIVTTDDKNNEVSETAVAPEANSVAPVLSESSDPVPISNVSSSNSSTGTTLSTDDFIEDDIATENGDVVIGLSAEKRAILEAAGVSSEDMLKASSEVPVEPVVIPHAASYANDIEMAFDEDCWTEVRDATGKILFSGVKSANSTLALTGNAPYRVVLGYARGVSSLKYKGEVFDFSSFTHQDLARFELK